MRWLVSGCAVLDERALRLACCVVLPFVQQGALSKEQARSLALDALVGHFDGLAFDTCLDWLLRRAPLPPDERYADCQRLPELAARLTRQALQAGLLDWFEATAMLDRLTARRLSMAELLGSLSGPF